MGEMIIILAATISVAMVIVIVVVVIGCIYLNKTQKKADPDSPSQYTNYTSNKPSYLFPEKLETLGAYFERFESDESRMFVTKISMLGINIKEGEQENIDNFHQNQQKDGKECMRVDLVDEKEPEQNYAITEAGANSVIENVQNINKTGYSGERMQEVQEKTNIMKLATGPEGESDSDFELSEPDVDLDITADLSKESSGGDTCEIANVVSSKLSDVNTRQNETVNTSTVTMEADTTLVDSDDSSRECEPICQGTDSSGKLLFLETILRTSEDLHDEEQASGRQKKHKRRRNESRQFKQFQIGMFRYYLVRVKRRAKKVKQKNTSSVSPCERSNTRSAPSSRLGMSYPRPDSQMGKSEVNVLHTNHRSLVDIRQDETRNTTAFRKATDKSTINTRTNNRTSSRINSARYRRRGTSQPSGRSVSMKDIRYDLPL